MARLNMGKGLNLKIRTDDSISRFVDTLTTNVKSTASHRSPYGGMKKFSQAIRRAILEKYDATASIKNTRRKGYLRQDIKATDPLFDGSGNITFNVARDLPDYWAYVEYGIKGTRRKQTYQAIYYNKRDRIPPSLKRSWSDPINKGIYRRYRGGMRLISRKKEELVRIKHKVTISFRHPGFKGHFFVREGVIFARTNYKKYITEAMLDAIKDANMRSKNANAKA